jgi:hypothetical protein
MEFRLTRGVCDTSFTLILRVDADNEWDSNLKCAIRQLKLAGNVEQGGCGEQISTGLPKILNFNPRKFITVKSAKIRNKLLQVQHH